MIYFQDGKGARREELVFKLRITARSSNSKGPTKTPSNPLGARPFREQSDNLRNILLQKNNTNNWRRYGKL
jgi:hypothetical protein